MSDVEWDDEPPSRTTAVKDRWEGEDEDDVKDNWDDENDEEVDENKPTDNGQANAVPAKKKKSLKEKIAEKEEKKRLEQEQKRKEQEEEADMHQLSPEEMATEKARQRQLQEESDLLLAMQTFGVSDGVPVRGQIDGMEPLSKEDFDKFEELLRAKITKYEKSPHYVPFLENLFRQIAIDLEADDIKRLGSTLTALSNEKAKQQKGTKGKKKKQKASLVVGKDTDDVLAETGGYDEYDDFL